MKISIAKLFSLGFSLEFIFYALSMLLAIGVAIKLSGQSATSQVASQSFNWNIWTFIIAFFAATVILFLILKYVKKPWLLKFIFYLVVIEGVWIFSQAYFDFPYNVIFFALIIIFWLGFRNVLSHNLVIILSASSIAVLLGFNFLPATALFALLAIDAYDYWAVYKTKHMVKMFQGMAAKKVYFTFIIPNHYRGLFLKVGQAEPGADFFFLGTGDVVLPAIFVVSCLQISLFVSLITAIGSLAGLVLLDLVYINRKVQSPMPGLPLISAGVLVGFLIALIIKG